MNTNTSCSSNSGSFVGFFILVILIVFGIVICSAVPGMINNIERFLNDNANMYDKENAYVMTTLFSSIEHPESGHAFKHPDAELVHQCINNGGILNTFRNPINGKSVNIVCVPIGDTIQWGVQFLNKIDREITAFIKNPEFYKNIGDVIKYVTTSGYSETIK